jgi:hypothetical protein
VKRGLIFALCVLVAGLASFGLTRWLASPAVVVMNDEITWIRDEFHLSPAQTAAIEKLHDDYFPVCMEHCKLVVAARKSLASAPVSEKPAAQAELLRLETVCQNATRAHLQRVAAVMPPGEGQRFLALVLPKLTHLEHTSPLGLK